MNLSPSRFQKGLPRCGWLFAGLLFAGCGHLYYADPNPPNAFAFPSQNQPSAIAAPTPAPPPGSPVGPVTPVGPVVAGASPGTALPGTGATVSDILRVGETITVSFSDIPPPGLLPVVQRIRDDRQITLPFNVTVVAAGKTLGQLQDDIRIAYVPKYYVQMTASVKSEERFFFVQGEVKSASRLPYAGEMTVLRAITSAGGFTDFANRKKIELLRGTGQKFVINWFKAIKNPALDLPVYQNDQVVVHKKIW